MSTDAQRAALVQGAFRLESATIGWMVIEFLVALYAGLAAHSLALVAFSLDSLIEIGHAGVLIWRLRTEWHVGKNFPQELERRAARIGGFILAALALYIATSALWELWHRQGAEFSLPGLVITIIAIPLMWWIAQAKYRYADALGSRALRGDAAETVSCAYLSAVIVVALIAQWLVNAWWIDGAASLAIVYFIAREAREGFEDEHDYGEEPAATN